MPLLTGLVCRLYRSQFEQPVHPWSWATYYNTWIQTIQADIRLRNNLYCVRWGVKLYAFTRGRSLTTQLWAADSRLPLGFRQAETAWNCYNGNNMTNVPTKKLMVNKNNYTKPSHVMFSWHSAAAACCTTETDGWRPSCGAENFRQRTNIFIFTNDLTFEHCLYSVNFLKANTRQIHIHMLQPFSMCWLNWSASKANSAFHPSRVGKWVVIHVISWITRATIKWQKRNAYGCQPHWDRGPRLSLSVTMAYKRWFHDFMTTRYKIHFEACILLQFCVTAFSIFLSYCSVDCCVPMQIH